MYCFSKKKKKPMYINIYYKYFDKNKWINDNYIISQFSYSVCGVKGPNHILGLRSWPKAWEVWRQTNGSEWFKLGI